jgi:glycolate oxidase subunit GlcD
VTVSTSIELELAGVVGRDWVLPGTTEPYTHDATVTRGLSGGRAEAVVLPGSAAEVAGLVAWCYSHEVPLVPRGGGTGLAGGAVPSDGSVVMSLERLNGIRSLVPELWELECDAGVTTARIQELARSNGLFFPPDPGGAEQSQIGGNIATNAGGPHAFKYGVTGKWVTGLEVVVPPGEVVRVGGRARKDVRGYDLKSVFTGSEGTLGIITAARLRLIPAPEARFLVAACYTTAEAGCEAITRVLASGLQPAVLECADSGALAGTRETFPSGLAPRAKFLVVAEADGTRTEAASLRDELLDCLAEGALETRALDPTLMQSFLRWRDGLSYAVTARRGHKLSEDVAVPVDQLSALLAFATETARNRRVETASWGHAGDGNLHVSFLVDPDDPGERERAVRACEEVVEFVVAIGGSFAAEHGVGSTKVAYLHKYGDPAVLQLNRRIKQAFDPKGLLNPGKGV